MQDLINSCGHLLKLRKDFEGAKTKMIEHGVLFDDWVKGSANKTTLYMDDPICISECVNIINAMRLYIDLCKYTDKVKTLIEEYFPDNSFENEDEFFEALNKHNLPCS